jgi:2-dehydropantoate 2-reductase
MNRLHIGVLGPGAVGGLLAALASREGAQVTCVATAPTSVAITESGLTLTSDLFGSFHSHFSVSPTLTEPVDILLVTVKAQSLADALGRIPTHLESPGVTIPFLNGIEHVATLRDRFGNSGVVPGTIRVESHRLTPGMIVHSSPFAKMELAATGENLTKCASFVELMTHAGVDVSVRDDESAMLWDKLAFLAPLALLTTFYDVDAGSIRTLHRATLVTVITEITDIATSEGVQIKTDIVLSLFDQIPATMTSSMQRDAAAHRPTEIEAIGGSVLRVAERNGIRAPLTEQLVEELRRR